MMEFKVVHFSAELDTLRNKLQLLILTNSDTKKADKITTMTRKSENGLMIRIEHSVHNKDLQKSWDMV